MSLGVDLIPYKTCSYDCIYCELGKTTKKTILRKEYISKDLLIGHLEEYLSLLQSPPDYITISGSGEPTLNSKIGEIIKEIKCITTIPVAVITNGSLFFLDQVKEDLLSADVVLPSLDAVNPTVFKHINRPEPSLDINNIVKGFIDFRKEFHGEIWLEILFCRVLNDDRAEIARLRERIEDIKPERIQLNTVVRPSSYDFAYPLSEKQLVSIKETLGTKAEIISDIVPSGRGTHFADEEEKIIGLIARRPCTFDDICNALELHSNETLKYLNKLQKEGRIHYKLHHHSTYYQLVNV
ncbi:MAG: radical SAM protein [Deltaproteobacteria bacterium]|nr:radical SAM protein [Deltaproteobacteria bacterium]